MKVHRPDSKMFYVVQYSIDSYSAIASNGAFSPQARRRGEHAAKQMKRIQLLLKQVKDNKTLFE